MSNENNFGYENLHLVYVEKIGKNSSDFFEYDFFFSENPDTVYGDDWGETCPSACGNLRPDDSMYQIIRRLKTQIPLMCAQENNCFSMADCTDHIIALCFEKIDEYDSYPEPYRIVIQFGESFETVEDKLAGRNQFFDSLPILNGGTEDENDTENDDSEDFFN